MNTILAPSVNMTARWEVFVPTVYPDKDGSLVIGFGHTNNLGTPPFVKEGMVLTEQEAWEILRNDLEFVGKQVRILYKGIELNDYQFSALCDVCFNRGYGRLRDSAVTYYIKHPEIKNNMVEAAKAFIIRPDFTNPDTGKEFSRLNYAMDLALGHEREYLGLTARRIDNGAMFQVKTPYWT